VLKPGASVVIAVEPKVRTVVAPKVIVCGLKPVPVMVITSPTLPVDALSAIAAVATVNVADTDSTPSETVTVYSPAGTCGTVNVLPPVILPTLGNALPVARVDETTVVPNVIVPVVTPGSQPVPATVTVIPAAPVLGESVNAGEVTVKVAVCVLFTVA